MVGMRRNELDDCGLMTCGGIAAGGWENGRLDNFLHGVGAIYGTHLCC